MIALRVLTLACVTVAFTHACELHEEIYKGGEQFVMTFVIKHDKTLDPQAILGCLKALISGDVDKCNSQKFRLPQFPGCETCAKHKDVKEKCKEYNIKKVQSVIENLLFSCGEDADDICEKIPMLVKQGIAILESYISEGPEAAKGVADKFCDSDPDTCEQMKGLPDKIFKKLKFDFKDFVKNLKSTGKSKGVALGGSFANGIKMAFGGDDFGEAVSKCVLEVTSSVVKKVAL